MNYSNLYIGFDRDGTLDLPNLQFDTNLAYQLKGLKSLGAKLFLASGKGCEFLNTYFKEFDVEFDIVCGENGGHIISNNVDYIKKCSNKHLDVFIDNLPLLNLPFFEEEPKKSIWTGRFFDKSEHAGKIIRQFIDINKLDLQVYIHPDNVGAVDVVPNVVDKTNVLEFIPYHANIHFFGDGNNDLSLMKHQRVIPHTVENATPEVKSCVQNKNGNISKLIAKDGVADGIGKLFLRSHHEH